MSFTGYQVVAARGLLNISQEELAKKVGIAKTTLLHFEKGDSEPRESVKQAIEKTLNDLGVEFKDGGVIPKKSIVEQFFSKDAYYDLQDDIINKTSNIPDTEVLLYGIDESFANEKDIFFAKQLNENNIKIRAITRLGAKTSILPKENYRFLGEDIFCFTPFAIYSNNLALVYPDLNAGKDHVIIIRNGSLAKSFKKQFNHFWKIGKKKS